MMTLTWVPERIKRVPVYPMVNGAPTDMRVFRSLNRPRSEPYHETWEASSDLASQAEKDHVLVVRDDTMNGAGPFLWTPPGKTEGIYRFVGGTLRYTRARAAKRYAITVQIEKV